MTPGNRNKLIAAVVLVLAIFLGVLFISQVRRLKQELRTAVRIVPTESKSREDTMRSGPDENASRSRAKLLVKFRAGVSPDRINKITNDFNDRVQDEIESVPGLIVLGDPDETDAQTLTMRYQALAEVEYAEPNFEVTLDSVSKTAGVNDSRFDEQWWLADINAAGAWATTKGSEQIVVAVLDSGVEYTHADLKNNIWIRPAGIAPYQDRDLGTFDDLHGFNAVANDGDPMDDNGHGTACAGIIGAECGNQVGICGVNWKTKIMPLKFINAGGFGTVVNAIEAINYAINRKRAGVNLRVINASWGLPQPSQALEDVIRQASGAGILFVAAAGNQPGSNHYPAAYKLENLISVAANDQHGKPGSANDDAQLFAPGVNILTAALGNEFEVRSGSSMAAAVVSGVAALTLAAHPGLSVDQLRAVLLASISEKSSGSVSTGKRVDAGLAVKGN